jgi:hypothetical protein
VGAHNVRTGVRGPRPAAAVATSSLELDVVDTTRRVDTPTPHVPAFGLTAWSGYALVTR